MGHCNRSVGDRRGCSAAGGVGRCWQSRDQRETPCSGIINRYNYLHGGRTGGSDSVATLLNDGDHR